MAFDVDGSLLVCEQVSSCLVRFHATDAASSSLPLRRRVPEQPERRRRAGRDGSIYFTDPDYGRWNDWIGCERGSCSASRACTACLPEAATASSSSAPDEFEQPNGLCFSPDESLLYVNDSPRAEIKVFDVAADGSLVNCRMFRDDIGEGTMEEGNVDGMECDELGNVWTSGPGGVWVLNPQGERIGVIRTPRSAAASCWAAPTCTRCSSPPRPRCTCCRPRSPARRFPARPDDGRSRPEHLFRHTLLAVGGAAIGSSCNREAVRANRFMLSLATSNDMSPHLNTPTKSSASDALHPLPDLHVHGIGRPHTCESVR